MARRCELTDKGNLSGNKVSHSNRKTPRSFSSNIQKVTLRSDALGRVMSLRIAVSTLRSIDHNGGFDAFISTASDRLLSDLGKKFKRQVRKALQEREAA